MGLDQLHSIFEIGGLLIGALIAFIGVLIKDSINEVKLLAAATKLEIVTGQFRIESKIDQHLASDDAKHTDFERRITRIEDKKN